VQQTLRNTHVTAEVGDRRGFLHAFGRRSILFATGRTAALTREFTTDRNATLRALSQGGGATAEYWRANRSVNA
jgi:hypothetical protein